jgi:NAD(P)H-nitrite reductase large subunit
MGKSRTSSVNAMSETGQKPQAARRRRRRYGRAPTRRCPSGARWRGQVGGHAARGGARAPYDRVALTSYFTGRDPDDLALGSQEIWHDRLVSLKRGVKVTAVDREKRTVTTADGSRLPYDALVLATGSYAAVPPVKGNDLRGTSSTAPSMMSPTCARSWRAAATTSAAPCAAPSSAEVLGLEAASALCRTSSADDDRRRVRRPAS